MKKLHKSILIISSVLAMALFNSCQLMFFLEPGYWQQLGERLSNSGKNVDSMPDVLNKYTWQEMSFADAQSLWESAAYRSAFKNLPDTANIYQNHGKTIKLYKETKADKFPNKLYSTDIAKNIYVFPFQSDIYGENYIALNEYIPALFPEDTKFYVAAGSTEYVKTLFTLDDSKDTKCTMAFKNGLLVQRIQYTETYIEY